MKQVKKLLAIILAIATLMGVFSCGTSVFAEEYNEYINGKAYEEKLLTEAVENENEKAEIIGEVPEKRDEFSKTYKRADGSYTSIVSQVPLHTLENGQWNEIVNTLQEEAGEITNEKGSFDVTFPETIDESEKINISNGDASLSFSVNGIKNAPSSITKAETEKSIIEKDLNKTISEITYEGISKNTDLQYIVSPTSVKENIVVYNKNDLKETYSFTIEKGDLSVKLDKENNLIFKNEKNETVFTIPAPVMTDAVNAVSYEIDVAVEKQNGSVLLTYTPSKEWLESADRVYPVKIDPVIVTQTNREKLIEDTVIINSSANVASKNTNYYNSPDGYIADYSKTDSNGNTQNVKANVLIKINMDAFEAFKNANVTITDVNFFSQGYVNGGNVLAKPIVKNWNNKTITYEDVYPTDGSVPEINFENKIIDFFTGGNATDTVNLYPIYFNITEIFNQWLTGSRENNGFGLVPESSNIDAYIALGSYTSGSGKSTDSYCVVDYVDTSNNDADFEYLTQEAGRAGVAKVNILSRGLSLSRSDVSMDGLRMPVAVDFKYNNALSTFVNISFDVDAQINGEEAPFPFSFGNNWLCSFSQMLFITEGQEINVFTGSGDVLTFAFKEESVTDENQQTSTTICFEEQGISDSGYSMELIDSAVGLDFNNIKLTTPEGEAVYFNEMGMVTEIWEAEPDSNSVYDKISIAYDNEDPFKIEYITDGIGRKYDFIYNSNTGLLSEIKCLTADGEPIKAGTTNEDLKVTYEYDDNGNLIKVNYPDGESVTYTYQNGNLVKAQNIDGYNIQYTYDNMGRVTKITEYAETTKGNSIALTQLSSHQVKVVDDYNGTETYQFGKDGRLQYTFDEKGNYLKSDYAPANDENVYSSNDWSISSQNLLKNGSFEEIVNGKADSWSNSFNVEDMEETENSTDYACRVLSAEPTTALQSQEITVDGGKTYTFSLYARANSTVASATDRLYMHIATEDEEGNEESKSRQFVLTEDFEQYSLTITTDTEISRLNVEFGLKNKTGDFYVNNAQLEKGNGTAPFNYVENGSFTDSASDWTSATIVNEELNNNPVKAVKLTGGLPQYTVEEGLDRPALEDHISATTQNIKINGKKGDTYSIGGWFKGMFDDNCFNPNLLTEYAQSTAQLTNSSAQIKVTYSYTDTVTTTDEATNETTTTEQVLTENFVLDFAPHNNAWQYATDTFALKGDTQSVDVTIMAKNVPEDCYVTGVELISEENAFSFVETEEAEEEEELPEEPEADNTDTENTTPEECPCEDCEELDCPCRCESADVCNCVQCNRRSDIETTSEDGKTVTTSSFDGENYMQSSITYSNDKNNIISETDENNISSGYAYNDNGSLTSFTDGAGNLTNYQSNPMGYLNLAQSNVSGLTDNAVKMAISYAYDGDLLTNVNQGNVQYTYEYDAWGQLKKVLVDGEALVCYNYNKNNNAYRTRIESIIFGDTPEMDFAIDYTYDLDGNIQAVEKHQKIGGVKQSVTYTYTYDNLGNLTSITDSETGHFLDYTDDGIVIKDGQDGAVIYQTKDVEIPENDTSNLVCITQEIANGTSYNHKIYESAYNDATGKSTENEAVSVVINSTDNNFTYGKTIGTQTLSDWFGRNEAVTVMTKDPVDTATTDFASISSQFGYVTNGNITTNLISSVTNTITGEETNTVNYNYTYDSNGRITNASTVSSVDELIGSSQYVYDEAGQLIKEITGAKTYEYAYDSKGNISTRKLYSNGALSSTDTFTYGAEGWEDRLTGYNNKTITYDSIGNPTSYLGATLSWRGRELASYIDNDNNKQISYSYDVDGMRYRKTVKTNGVETARFDYVYSDGTLILLTYTANGVSNTARFVYDSWGEPRGFMLNDSATYLYLKNAQGDITGIVDENGAVLLTYSYNAWGKVSFTATDMDSLVLAGTLSNVNPFTYRGYCYDYDIKMYYLQSRYYDPEICRFINADSTDYLGATGTLLSYNLFAYCENDGVNCLDATGTWAYDVHAGYYTKKKDATKKEISVDYVIGMSGLLIPYYISGKKENHNYYGTYYWATECEIHNSNAKIIAYHCNDVDNQFSPLLANYQSWHFDTNYTVNGSTDSRLIISFFMCLEASMYFDEALKYKKGSKKYKTAVKKGLMYLGYALHPIQDIYAHTPERCHKISVPYYYHYEDLKGQITSGYYFVSGWWHYTWDNTDNAQIRTKQVEKTKNHTYKILNVFVDNYGSILSRNNGVKI